MTQGSLQGKVNQSFPRRHALIEQPLSAKAERPLSLMCRACKNGRNLLTQVFSYEQFVRFIDVKEQKLGVLIKCVMEKNKVIQNPETLRSHQPPVRQVVLRSLYVIQVLVVPHKDC